MRKPILSFLLGSVVLCQIASAQYVQNALPPEDISSRPIFGDNQRLSHASRYAGPTVPQVRWVASGGAIHEPTDLQGTVVAPQMTAFEACVTPTMASSTRSRRRIGGPFGHPSGDKYRPLRPSTLPSMCLATTMCFCK